MFRLLAENIPDYAVFVLDPHRHVVRWSEGAERLLGFAEEEIVGRRCDCLFTPEDVERGVPQMELDQALAVGRGGGDRWHIRKDGSRFWSSAVVIPLRDAADTLQGFARILRDQTALRQAERATERLRESEQRLRAISDNLPLGAVYQILSSPDGSKRFTYISGGVERLLGVTPAEVLAGANALYGLVHEDDRGRVGAAEELAARDLTPFDCEFRSWTRRGNLAWVHARSAPHRLPSGETAWEGIVME
jgi:PAS domain S-box-containing protein